VGLVGCYVASTVLPYRHDDRAVRALRGKLRLLMCDVGDEGIPDWSTLDVVGPVEAVDGRGRTWFEWSATVETRPLGSH
jgi:hypothetical protein